MGKEAYLMHAKASVAATSLDDEELYSGVNRLIGLWKECNALIDPATCRPRVGKEDDYQKALSEIRDTAADLRRRGRELLEEV
jgi:hypothetical protein